MGLPDHIAKKAGLEPGVEVTQVAFHPRDGKDDPSSETPAAEEPVTRVLPDHVADHMGLPRGTAVTRTFIDKRKEDDTHR